MIYLNYSQEELNAQYNQATLVPDTSPYRDYWTKAGIEAREHLTCQLDVAYGASVVEKLDIFPGAGDNAPIHVHVHGGAWRQIDKALVSYPAPHFVAAGATYIALGFGHAPEYALSDIVDHVRTAIKWIWQNAASFNGDPDRIFISGASSGAHLSATVLADGWREEYGLPEDVIKGAILTSGPYDLDPVRLSARNEYLNLDQATADRNNPLKHIPQNGPPIFVCWGDGELEEFQRQGQAFADAWRTAGNPCDSRVLKGLNHFDVGSSFGKADSVSLQAALAQMSLAA